MSIQDESNLLPPTCKPSEAEWIVTEDKSYYPTILFLRNKEDALVHYNNLVDMSMNDGNPENVFTVTMAQINSKHIFTDYTQ